MGVEFARRLERDARGRFVAVQGKAPDPVGRPLLRQAGENGSQSIRHSS
jgi:hypothetical protein